MTKNIFNEGTIMGNCFTGDKNIFINFYIMAENNLNETILKLANSQSKLVDAIAETMTKRAEADLIKAQKDKVCAENHSLELKIRETEINGNNSLIESMNETLKRIDDRLNS